MLELPHTIVGATIALKVGNPALALPLALASHFIVDMIPHWNPHLNREMKENGKLSTKTTYAIIADVGLSLLGGFFIASRALPNIESFMVVIAGSFAGVLPDVIESPYYFFRQKSAWLEKFIAFQKSIQNNAPPVVGILTQVILLAACFWWILG